MKPAMPTPMSTSASRTLTAAMMPIKRFVVLRSGAIGLLSPPAAALRTAGDVVQRSPPFVGRASRLFHRSANAGQLAEEVIELGFDLVADSSTLLRQVQPAPHATNDCPQTRCHQH